ncbi:AMP-binding protein [Legionella spiritensis]|uniref:AMP-binding protein n=1 Tax=Legionella spiritensis TaxID=452 RepID=UPI000F6C70CC|nr:AMP-binding protein [Legionella spiritensis]VEG91825.1 peptide synthetase [Legionella spiritensis]
MQVKNELARKLLDALFSPESHFSLTDGVNLINKEWCRDKIRQYIDWLNQLDVHSAVIISTPGIETLCLCYALVISDKTYIPVHTSTSSELLQRYLNDYQIDLLLVEPGLASHCDHELRNRLVEEEDRSFYYYRPLQTHQTFCLSPGIVFFTSGTTAQPKAVHYHYATLLRYIVWCVDEFNLNNKDHVLFTTELSFVASLRPLFVPVLSGANVVFANNFSANKLQLFVNTLVQNEITVLNVTATLFKMLLRHIETSGFISAMTSVRLALLSGEPLDLQDIDLWFERIKQDTIFYNLYGATECLVPFYKKVTGSLLEKERLHLGQLRAGCSYKLLPSAKGYELYVAGDISTSYLDPALTQSRYITVENQRFIKTEDIVERCDRELFYISRAQRIVKRYGQIVNLDQIEYILKKSRNHLNFITFTSEDKNNIYLLICGAPESDELLRHVKQTLKQHLPGYMHPSEYFFSRELPLTCSGKIDYSTIKKAFVREPISTIYDYFKRFFRDNRVNAEARIVDLGLESIDYMDMAEAFWQLTGKWLDVSKITDDMIIANIASCLVDHNVTPSGFRDVVQLNTIRRGLYEHELQGARQDGHYITTSFALKGEININRLELAIAATIANHFMLSSKLVLIDDDYYFARTTMQTGFRLRAPVFPGRNNVIGKLKTCIHADRLFNAYIQKRKGQYFLIMAYHHIVIDGWSTMMIREEIFRRYEGAYKIKSLKQVEEIEHLNQANQIWPADPKNINKLKSMLSPIDPEEYNRLDPFFNGSLCKKHTIFCVNKNNMDEFARSNQIQDFPYSVLFSLLLHRIISQRSGVKKLYFYMSFSNRNFPVPDIKELITNLATGLPVFFDSKNLSAQELARQMQDILTCYFKNMSYGAITEIWQKEFIQQRILLPRDIPYIIVYTYINKIVDNDYVQNHYIDWLSSEQDVNFNKKGVIFLRVYNMGSYFVINMDSQMKKGLHNCLIEDLQKFLPPKPE